MRVMVLIKATEDSEAGVMPSRGAARGDGQVQRGAGQGRRDARRRGAAAELQGRAGARSRAASADVIDGPFAETKELIAGFWIWQVKSLDEAIEWVKRVPDPMPGSEARSRSARSSRPRTSARSSRPSCASEEARAARAGRGEPVAGARRRRSSVPVSDVTPHDRRRLADRVAAADRRPGADRARRRRWPRTWRRTRWSPRSSSGRSRASRTTRAPG